MTTCCICAKLSINNSFTYFEMHVDVPYVTRDKRIAVNYLDSAKFFIRVSLGSTALGRPSIDRRGKQAYYKTLGCMIVN